MALLHFNSLYDNRQIALQQSSRLIPSWRPARRRINKLIIPLAVFAFLCFLVVNRSYDSRDRRRRSHGRIQYDFGADTRALPQFARQHAVRKEFIHAWTAYADHAWMTDSLSPLTGDHENQFCGWSATLVDALDTLWIMGLDEEFDEAVHALQDIKFDDPTNTCTVNLFETTIRHLGGLISAYDLSQDEALLPKLVELGDVLHRAFATENGMPCSHCQLMSQPPETFTASTRAAMAAQGSLFLEFGRLAQITKNPKYMDSVMNVTNAFARTQNDSTIPGLWPEYVDASSVDGDARHFAVTSFKYSIGALSDSTYEYLVKSHLLLGKVTSKYKEMWKLAASQIRKFLLFRAQVPGASTNELIFSGNAMRWSGFSEVELEPRIEHLGCFAGGMFALASKIFDEPDDFYIGEALTNGCVWAYQHAKLGIMPESATLLACENDNGTQCEEDNSVWSQATKLNEYSGQPFFSNSNLPPGFIAVNDARYLLRPEAIESVFIMWRLTGNPYWRDAGWEMFKHIREHTWSPFGHAALENVMEISWSSPGGRAKQRDEMESFWYAETLKYFYLLFSEVDLVSLDEYVLNTEAHPMKLTHGIRGF